VLLVTAFILTQYGPAWRVPFLNEDYSFLDLTRGRSFWGVWRQAGVYAGPWFRPWSQTVHYWLMQAGFGSHMPVWHAASWALGITVLVSYWALVKQAAGLRSAAIATTASAALVGWGLPLTWIAGVQDLWMLAFALAMLHAVAARRVVLGCVLLLFALLSKETAAVLPVVAFGWIWLVEEVSIAGAARRALPLVFVALAWALIHPALGGRWWLPIPPDALHAPGTPTTIIGSALLAALNLDAIPKPESGWLSALLLALLGAVPLTLLIRDSWSRESMHMGGGEGTASASTPDLLSKRDVRLIAFGATWCVSGCAPLLAPGIHWHSYYSLLASLGAWFALSVPLRRVPRLALAIVLALAMLRAGRSTTVLHDWGEESYARRAGQVLSALRDDLLAKVPTPVRSTRFWFHDVPSEAGFLVGDGPSIRLWYGDSTLRGGYYNDYVLRPSGSVPGPERFFRFDRSRGWVEVATGPEDVEVVMRTDPTWAAEHQRLAATLSRAEDWPRAAEEYAKLAVAFPDSVSYPYLAGLAKLSAGDSLASLPWLRRAAQHPGADAEMREVLKSLLSRERRR
jgi:hypothetical protein